MYSEASAAAKFGGLEQTILEFYYGIGTKAYTIGEIADLLEVSRIEVKDTIDRARTKLERAYRRNTQTQP
jgi:predicted DNA-binding protein YlxM (UPF0122 family)